MALGQPGPKNVDSRVLISVGFMPAVQTSELGLGDTVAYPFGYCRRVGANPARYHARYHPYSSRPPPKRGFKVIEHASATRTAVPPFRVVARHCRPFCCAGVVWRFSRGGANGHFDHRVHDDGSNNHATHHIIH